MTVKITTLRSNFNKLNESIKQYIAEGKPSPEFLAKLVNLDHEGVLNSFPDAWITIFRKYYDAKFFHFCEFQATRHENEFVKFLSGLKTDEQADCINSIFRRQLGPDHKSLFALVYSIIFHQEKHGLGGHIIGSFARYYDLKSVVGVIDKIRKDHVFDDNLRIRFDQECETTEDFSVWKHPIFKEVLSDKQKMRLFETARKKNCDAIDYAVALGIDLEKTKPQFTDDLLRKNDLRQIRRDFNPKLHDQDRVLAHVTELIKKEQNPDPTELAKEFLNGDGRIPFSEMVFLMPRFPFRGY